MNKQKFLRAFAALSMVLVLMISCFSVNVFADTTASGETTAEVEVSGTVSGNESETKSPETTVNASETTKAPETTAAVTTGTANNNAKKFNWTSFIVTVVFVVIVAIIAVVYYVKNTEKVKEFWRGYKGELKNITWLSKKELKRSTVVVCVIVVIAVVVIALFDYVFSNAIWLLMDLFM